MARLIAEGARRAGGSAAGARRRLSRREVRELGAGAFDMVVRRAAGLPRIRIWWWYGGDGAFPHLRKLGAPRTGRFSTVLGLHRGISR